MEIHSIDLSASLGQWTLSVAPPAERLSRFVNEFWEVKGQLVPFTEGLLPNGHVEVMVNLGPPHRVLEGAGAGEWKDSWFSGLQERAIQIETLEGTHLISARLHPLGAATLLGPGVTEWVNSVVSLETLIGKEAAILRENLRAISSVAERFEVLQSFLDSRITGITNPVPDLVWKAAGLIESQHGRVKITELHETLGVSRKHLSVTFSRFMGLSPKAYALIQRFLWTLDRLRDSDRVEWSTLAAEAGYSDQSHLSRDFVRIGAASPEEYLRRALPGTTALLND
jgi:AraC-like DNA-binding protein